MAGEGGREGTPAPAPTLQSSCCCSSGGGGALARAPPGAGGRGAGSRRRSPARPRCQGAGRGAGLPAPGRPCSSAPAAAPAAPGAIVLRLPGLKRATPRLWPLSRSSLKTWPQPRSRSGSWSWAQSSECPRSPPRRRGHPASADQAFAVEDGGERSGTRIPACGSASAGKWTARPGWNQRYTWSICTQLEQ
nr:translation initiation factor IF-2-like isoform X2 [Chlorocebus sabaeus]